MSLTKSPVRGGPHPTGEGDSGQRRPWSEALTAAAAGLVATMTRISDKVAIGKDRRRRLPPAADRADRGRVPGARGLLPPPEHPDPGQPRRALVITGEQPVAEALARVMHLEGLCVDWAGTGSLGVRLVELEVPDLVLLDALMTGPDGSAVGSVLRARSGVPIIVVCRGENRDAAARDIAGGADGLVAWPFSVLDVRATVRRVLNQRGDDWPVIDLREQQPIPCAAASARPRHAGRVDHATRV